MAPGTKPAGKKPIIEYREPMSNLGERYLGACNHPFTRQQIESVATKMPPYFSSIKGHARGKNVCLFTSAVFLTRTRDAMIKNLKASCTKWAGTGSEKACQELISDLSPAKPTTTQTTPAASPSGDTDFKPYDPHATEHYDPRNKTVWLKLVDALINGLGFAVAGAFITEMGSRIFTGKSILTHIRKGRDGGDDDDTPKTPPAVGGGEPLRGIAAEAAKLNIQNMVAAALGMAAALVDKLDDIKMPPLAPPFSFDLDPVHPIGSAPIGYEDPNYVPISTSTSISWAAVGAWLSSAGDWIADIERPHSPDTNTWADYKIGEPMAQAGRNMAAAMTAGAQKLMSVKPKNMPSVVFTGLVIVTAPIWVPVVLAYGSLSLVGSMIGPALPELMNEHDKMTGKKAPGPA